MRLAFGKGLFESVFLVFLLFGLRCLGESDGSFERADSALSKCVSAFQKPLNPYDSVAYYDAEGYRRWCSSFTASEPKFGKDLQFKKKSTRMSAYASQKVIAMMLAVLSAPGTRSAISPKHAPSLSTATY